MDVLIFGTEDCASLANFYLTSDSEHKVLGFCVNESHRSESHFEGLPVYSFEDLPYTPSEVAFFAPLYDNDLRSRKTKEIKSKGFSLISYLSSKATCWGSFGENCFIMEDNTIQPFVKIGNNVVMWSGNHIGHHSTIKDDVFISSHVVISGRCLVESFCWFGVNSATRDNITISEGTMVAMSSMIHKTTKPWHMYMGVPAKPIKSLK
jgi:sugar O-acyltransferase (sialic acid O-acetyltransferase NeuD family)